jgi:[ribosomal protein S5]-alanine N-acetyltransferase
MMIFESERLKVRYYEQEEFDEFFRLNSDEEVMRYIRPPQPYDVAKEFFEKVVASYKEQPGLGRFSMRLKKDDSFIGSFAVIPVENSIDIQLGYALLKENWNKGYASESVRASLPYIFNQLKLQKIAAITEVANISSQNVLLKNGFKFSKTYTEKEKDLNLYYLEAGRWKKGFKTLE